MKLLYKIPLVESAQDDESEQDQATLSESGALESDESVVEQLASDPEEIGLRGRIQFGEPFSQIIAKELKELAQSSIEDVPLFRIGDRDWDGAGYYELQDSSVEPAHTNAEEVFQYDISLSNAGTKGSRFRRLEVASPVLDAEHEFGNDMDYSVGVPASARKVQWLDTETRDREIATALRTEDSEFGEIDIYDPGDADIGDPDLIYEIEHVDEAPSDCAIYDTRGQSEKYEEREEGRARQWQSIFVTSHDIDNAIVMDNGLIRLWLDEVAGTVGAQYWELDGALQESGLYGDDLYGDGLYYGTEGGWVDAGLENDQPDDVELFDIDITSIGMARDRVQLTFDVSGSLFALDATLHRGRDEIQFSIPQNESGPIPNPLEGWLEPIASTSIVDTNAVKTLISRTNVRR